MAKYIYEWPNWTDFVWDGKLILECLTKTAALQGRLLGKMQQFGFGLQQEAMLNALAEEITKSSEIEGEILNSEQVRSSLARQLNLDFPGQTATSRHIDGLVSILLDATRNYHQRLDCPRLFGWHAALFPLGYSGMRKIKVAGFRQDGMQIVSTKGCRDIVYYEAPEPRLVPSLMRDFLRWLNNKNNENNLLKAAISHLWFVIIHPFEDGNGRIARTIGDMLLARAENTNLRFYSLSAQIQKEKKDYYRILEKTTIGTRDITAWLIWFFACLGRAIEDSASLTAIVLRKAAFWQKNAAAISDEKQRKIINLLFDGFQGNLTSGKVEKICKISQDTATRLLQNLTAKGFLKVVGAGRGTHYILAQ
ncbi:cell filamentation protein Fic [Candidatus Termititenax persephonae]|uniref:Cell filamentation protein Fic n=1 Tax=Candidatus Termititenax persephonae TaxID=2218525 RepID=A0A388TET1_9BACT|nr:cell filamentation protein Fic [Candidatus Termititenax persephonae]